MTSSVGETSILIYGMLTRIKERCIRLIIPFPRIIFSDNAAAHEATFKKVFPQVLAGQDLVHLIKRPLEHVKRNHDFYGSFCKAFHEAFTTSTKVPVKSRNGKMYNVKGPLDAPDVIIDRVEKVIAHWNTTFPDLLNDAFFKSWETQKTNIRKYVFEVYINGMYHHFYFILLNRVFKSSFFWIRR